MKSSFFVSAAIAVCLICCQSTFGYQDENPQKSGRFGNAEENKVQEGTITFTFNDQDWQDVIPWFADQAGYTLQTVTDWPQGTFSLKDREGYTIQEAIDQLNHSLRLLRPEPFTLIRNRKKLYLTKLADASFPHDLIERVKIEDLDRRGKYEIISCLFDLDKLNAEDMYDQISPLISDEHKRFFAVFPASNQIIVRETGAQLREIRNLINAADKRQNQGDLGLKVYTLTNRDSESFMLLARGLLGMDEGRNVRDDGSLIIAVEPFGDQLFVKGTDEGIADFEAVAEKLDVVAEDTGEGENLDTPRLETYAVLVDPAHAFKILDTMLADRDGVRMGQDENTGAITILGRDDDHKLAQETLDNLSGGAGGDFALIQLENGDPAEIIMVLQSLFRQTAEDTDSGPVLLGNTDKAQIIVRGTPQEVAMVKNYVATLDENAIPEVSGSRSQRRIVNLSDREQETIMPMLEDLFGTTNRRNKLNIVMPEDRKTFRNRFKVPTNDLEAIESFDFPDEAGTPDRRQAPQQRTQPLGSEQQKTQPLNGGSGQRTLPLENKSGFFKSTISDVMFALATPMQPSLVGLLAAPQESVGDTTQDQPRSLPSDQALYIPPPQVASVPGAPIEVKFTDYGVVLFSEDLDALDDLEYLIQEQFSSSSESQPPFFFFIKYRTADKVLAFLEEYYGMSSDGGGGGGGNLMTGMMSNMMGGGGDLLGGLLGGGLGGGSSSGDLEGDVAFGVDMEFNSLFVRNATQNDLDEINTLIEMLDQPEAPHEPDVAGEFRTIDVIHRDPEELKTIIEGQLADQIDTGQTQGGGGQNNEAAQMMKMMQQLTGGGRKGQSQQDLQQDRPKVKLGVDPSTSQILVTGPEFIYKKILKIVLELDKPELSVPPAMEMIETVGDNQRIKMTLKAMFGDMLEIVPPETADGTSTSNGQTATRQTSTAGSSAQQKMQAQQVEQARAAISRMMQQRAAGGGGGQRGGGQTRGGGGGTRGGGGGRGGR